MLFSFWISFFANVWYDWRHQDSDTIRAPPEAGKKESISYSLNVSSTITTPNWRLRRTCFQRALYAACGQPMPAPH